ncbi:MAG: JAB domain-containing protein [Lachnospiraceae bacterium]|nr:JAB domain-containing protein [Lachnospiraceae bacterium]
MRIKKYRLEYDDERKNMLVLESSNNFPSFSGSLNTPEAIYRVVNEVFGADKQVEEHGYLLGLDMKCHPVGFFDISHGDTSSAVVSMKSVFQRALLCGASQIVLLHNHPSGDPTPSKADSKLYEKIKEASKIMDIPLIDSIVIGNGCYYSFCENDNMH